MTSAACERHADRRLVLYCRDCSLAACEMCFIERHNGHRYASVEDVLELLRTQLDEVQRRLHDRISTVTQQLDTARDYRTQLTANRQVIIAHAKYVMFSPCGVDFS